MQISEFATTLRPLTRAASANHDLSSVKVSSGWASRWRAMPEKKSSSCPAPSSARCGAAGPISLSTSAAARLSVCKYTSTSCVTNVRPLDSRRFVYRKTATARTVIKGRCAASRAWPSANQTARAGPGVCAAPGEIAALPVGPTECAVAVIGDADARHAEPPPGQRDAIGMIEQPIVEVGGEFLGGAVRSHRRRLHDLGNFAANLGGKCVDRDRRVPGSFGHRGVLPRVESAKLGRSRNCARAGPAAIKPARMPRLPRVAGPQRMRYLSGTGPRFAALTA